MPEVAARSLPGIRFVSEPPPLDEVLPRMDIAVFVGFAARGPIDIPVAIEDAGDFAAIYGPDAPLAWDSNRGEVVSVYLGPAVRAFFRNGGTRCWVVRVAGVTSTNFFPIPGLVRVVDGVIAPAFARAASPGSWSDGLRVASTVLVHPLESGAPRTRDDAIDLDVTAMAGATPVRGDLLRLQTTGYVGFLPLDTIAEGPLASPPSDRMSVTVTGHPLWFRMTPPPSIPAANLRANVYSARREPASPSETFAIEAFVTDWGADDDGAAVRLDLQLDVAAAPEPGSLVSVAFGAEQLWLTVSDVGIKADGSDPRSDIVSVRGRGLWRLAPGTVAAPEPVTACDCVRLELWVRETEVRTLRLGDLGLAPAHPRYWETLTDDAERYDTDERPASARPELAEERDFPLAGVRTQALYLPLDVSVDVNRLLGAARQPRSALERDGLATFEAGLFVDPELADSLTDSLMDAADHLRYSRPVPRRPRGVHAALTVEEATLVAVPDACHRGWARALDDTPAPPQPFAPIARPEWWHFVACNPPQSVPLASDPPSGHFLDCGIRKIPAPENLRRLDDGEGGTYTLAWDPRGDAPSISVLEEARSSDFSDAIVVYTGAGTRLTVYGRATGTYYYRVRSIADAQTSDWSAGLAVFVARAGGWNVIPAEEFANDTLLIVQRALLRVAAARGDLLAVLALPAHFRENDTFAHATALKRSLAPFLGLSNHLARPGTTGLPIREQFGEARAFSFGAMYHPWLFIADQDNPGAANLLPPDGTLAGLLAGRARERGAWIAPANAPLAGVVALSPSIARGRRADFIAAQINLVTQEPRGFLTLSADTMSSDIDLVPIGVRRLLSLLRRLALREGVNYVFEPHDAPFRRLVQRGFEGFLSRMFERGAFAGRNAASSYQVVTSTSLNSSQSVDQGRFIVELRVAPALPMTFLTVRLVQSGDRTLVVEER